MRSLDTEILVIGAGPAGLIAAREAAARKAEVTVLEEHTEVGQPCHCAGLVSIEGLKSLNLPTQGPYIQNKVKGARFFSPSGLTFTVKKDKPVACVISRHAFDQFLAQQASAAGVHIRLGEKAKSVLREKTRVVIQGEKNSFTAKIAIDAEGVASRMLKAAGLEPVNKSALLPGVQYDLEGASVDPNYVEVHTGKKVAPSFYAWVIPLSRDTVRVGLGCKVANPHERLEAFVNTRFGNKESLEKLDTRSGLIVTCGPVKKSYADRLLAVGDAAGQVKPTTGGGVILGGICAAIAGEVAAEAVARDDYSASFLERYEERWRKQLSHDFRMMLLARRVMNRLSDRAIDKMFKAVIDENLQALLSAEGDMDFQSGVLLRLFRKKELLGILPSFLRALVPF
jgi:digeranylgeranylglycerophospholipid reductase